MGVLALSPCDAQAEQAPAGMVRYDHPVFHNGHRVLYHGIKGYRGGKVPESAKNSNDSDESEAKDSAASAATAHVKPAAPLSRHEFMVLVDTEDSCAARMAAEMVGAMQASGLKARAIAGRASENALGRYVVGDAADIAIAPLDALLADEKAPDWRARAPYVTRLGAETVEIIAAKGVTDINQLNGRSVSMGTADGTAEAVGQALFARLGVKPKAVRETMSTSLTDLASGKIDAVVVVGANDAKIVEDFGKGGRFHLVPIEWSDALRGAYAPTRLTAKERPNLIGAEEGVDTVAAPMALLALDAAPGSARATQDGAFVSVLFEKLDALQAAANEPSWKDVNLGATIDWPRLGPAQDWVASHGGSGDASLEAFRAAAHSVAAASGGPSASDADRLYQSLMQSRGAGQ